VRWLAALALAVLGSYPAARAAPLDKGNTSCREAETTRIWTSPAAPTPGSHLRLLAVSETQRTGNLQVTFPNGSTHTLPTTQHGGPPFSFYAELNLPASPWIRIELTGEAGKSPTTCRRIPIHAAGPAHAKSQRQSQSQSQSQSQGQGAWPSRQTWSRAYESFFSAWIERMFDVPPEGALAFPSLAPVLRDRARNFLWGYLGLGEDDAKNRDVPRATPDCADLPYYLRAYFAWKMELPFALRDCDRGTADRPPRCGPMFTNETPDRGVGGSPLGRWRGFLKVLANRVHSGSARTALADDQTDLYPVALTRGSLRPGTIYADPYGHVLMIAGWVDQTPERPGLLLAVDGQPDNSVGSKRFWEGTFLFVSDLPSAGPGFKAFRPVLAGPNGQLAQLSNRALAADPRFAPYADEEAHLAPDAFYARMAKLINPHGLDAHAAYAETMKALVEQLVTRLGSVDNGERYLRAQAKADPVPMPVGAKIFETTGAWEDYATPSRDMRLLIALRVLTDLPGKITQHPEIFLLGGRPPAEVRADIEAWHEQEIHARGIDYHRSDGSSFHLSVADVLARRVALEMAYNPNDCVEIRWGATPETSDYATCQRRAPEEQRTRMQEYRTWFHQTRRPPR
jgi:hypothetical protein